MIKLKWTTWISIGTAILGIGCLARWLYRPVMISVDGKPASVETAALTTGGILASGGIGLAREDAVSPGINSLMLAANEIQIRRARKVEVLVADRPLTVTTAEPILGNILLGLGIHVFPGDRLQLDGSPVGMGTVLPRSRPALIQILPATPIQVVDGAERRKFYSAAATLGEALWEAGIHLDPADRIDPPASTPLAGPLEARITRARNLTIQVDGAEIHLRSAASSVGEALADAGLSLQGEDYTFPAENQPISSDGRIRVVRVQEAIDLQEKQLPFKSSYQPDPNTELDQTSVVEPGVTGLQVTRIRVRMEDGKEVSRVQEGQWIARQPQNQILGYGTKVVVRTEVVGGVTLHYWRKINAYATSYSSCDAGQCGRLTASGIPAGHGEIAVIPSWYYAMKGQGVFIPGYGQAVIADIGGGIPGTNWVDLGFPDSGYVPWHSDVTVYFLTPVPANIPWVLP